jgi:hypothetical protein
MLRLVNFTLSPDLLVENLNMLYIYLSDSLYIGEKKQQSSSCRRYLLVFTRDGAAKPSYVQGHWVATLICKIIYPTTVQSYTYDHRRLRTELPVRSAVLKQSTGGLVVRWVTTGEYPLLYVFSFLVSQLPRYSFLKSKEREGRVYATDTHPPWFGTGQEACGLCRITSERRAGEIVYVCMYLRLPSSKNTK